MTDLNSTHIASDTPAAVSDDPASDAIKDTAADDWDTGPPRRSADRDKTVPVLNELSHSEMTDRYIFMLNELIPPTHKMSLEFLSVAGELSPDNPGRERKVNLGCKLAASTTKLIQAVEKLKNDGS